MSYLANRIHFLSLLGIKCQRDPMEPKQWKLIIKQSLLMSSRAEGSKETQMTWSHTKVKLFPCKSKCFFFFFKLFFGFVLFSGGVAGWDKYGSVQGSGSFQMCRCLWLHTSSLLGTITAVESKAIQSSISHCSTLLPSVKEVINGLMESSNDMDYTLPMQGLWF